MKGIVEKLTEDQSYVNQEQGSVGYALLKHAEELSMVENERDLMKLLNKVHKDVAQKFEQDWNSMTNRLDKQKTILRKIKYIYNYILAGDGLRTMGL